MRDEGEKRVNFPDVFKKRRVNGRWTAWNRRLIAGNVRSSVRYTFSGETTPLPPGNGDEKTILTGD